MGITESQFALACQVNLAERRAGPAVRRLIRMKLYLVENFGFDDSQLKTLGLGKQADKGLDATWGSIQILIYPASTELPADKAPLAVSSSSPSTESPSR